MMVLATLDIIRDNIGLYSIRIEFGHLNTNKILFIMQMIWLVNVTASKENDMFGILDDLYVQVILQYCYSEK